MSRHLSDWLEYYIKRHENSEPPIQYHLWSGIAAISAALQRKCYINWGDDGYIYPNFYICLVGPPGGRKGTAMRRAKILVEELNVPMGSDALSATQQLYLEIKNSQQMYLTFDGKEQPHRSLTIWSEEFTVFLSEKDPRLIPSITDLFDCPKRWKYSSIGRGADDLSNCWLSIIGATTPSLLQSTLSSTAVGGGLLSRMIVVVGYGASKSIPFSFRSNEDDTLNDELLKDFEQIHLLTGPFKISQDFMNTYGNWYSNVRPKIVTIDSNKFEGYTARKALHLRKLCMILSASESDDMEIKAHHFKKALAILEWTEAEMSNAFYGIGSGRHTEIYAKLVSWMEQQTHFTESDMIKKFQLDGTVDELTRLLSLAERAGVVKKELSSSCHTHFCPLPKADKKSSNLKYLNETVFSKLTDKPKG